MEKEEIVVAQSVDIYRKLHEMQKEVDHMGKEGRNQAQNYSYLSEAQVAEVFKELLEKHKVFFTYSSRITATYPSVKGTQLITDVRIDYQFIDIETGSAHSGYVCGQGADATDKGVYKGITGAVKYIFMKTFLIATGDDPEKDTKKSPTRATKADPTKPPFGAGSEEEED